MAKSKHRRKGVLRLPRRMRAGGTTATFSDEYRAQQPTPGTTMPSEQELRPAGSRGREWLTMPLTSHSPEVLARSALAQIA